MSVAPGGKIGNDKVFDAVDSMLNVCLRPAITASHVASKFLRPKGLLVLTGADSALLPTPDMIAYGLAKDATHYLTKSLALGGLPDRTVVCVLPATIDTPSNRCGDLVCGLSMRVLVSMPPQRACCLCVCVCLCLPMVWCTREAMPKGDFSSWTQPSLIARKIADWATGTA